jgi:FtsH-binding integral membrane protein
MSESHPPASPEPAPASPEQIRQVEKHLSGYKKICGLQILFALAAVAISFGPFHSTATQVTLTLLVSAGNGLLVAGILMHLKEEKQTIWKFLIFTGIFFFVLFFLTYLARTDLISQTFHNHH